MTTHQLRTKFLDFFRKRDHTIVPSDSLVPSGDPTLLFTSAGMVQFKKHFLGQTPPSFRRAASSQKCLRTTDIEKVGQTGRHLTFFEMLGNFSFGDYFKSEAIEWGWEFLTKECGLNPKLLYASVFKEDNESYELWKKFLPESKIVRLPKDSNFWMMGESGPCGPCSEILYDQGEKFSCKKSSCAPGCDCERYLEVWNLVFTQFDKQPDGTLAPLPQKNIDTGMGLERLTVVVNGFSSIFEVDSFSNLLSNIPPALGYEGKARTPKPLTAAHRLIADHIRAATFLISDGILPSNEGRGYVLRRLIRRAIYKSSPIQLERYNDQPFLYKLVPVVVNLFKETYPELSSRQENIVSILKTEEENFISTLKTGNRYFAVNLEKWLNNGLKVVPGKTIFYLHDTYGFPVDLSRELLAEHHLTFNEAEFEKAKTEAQEISRKGWKGSGEKDLRVYSELQKKIKPTIFRGYKLLELETEVVAILKPSEGDDAQRLFLEEGEEGEIVLAETPFYAESGGQVGDKGQILDIGYLILDKNQHLKSNIQHPSLYAEVLDTQEPIFGLIVHRVKVKKGKIKVGENVFAKVDADRRRHTMRHHTATHLLHSVLRKILGNEVTQAGSLVAPEKLRFDFTYPNALSLEQIAQIELEVNRAILDNIPRKREECSLEEARRRGALAFFGEKYGEKVFVVNYGSASTEVCGGTHCQATGEIGLFKIISESSVGSGVRRIEALAGEKALEFLQKQEKFEKMICQKLRCSLSESPEKIEKLLSQQKELERQINNLKKKIHEDRQGDLEPQAKTILLKDKANGKVIFLAEVVEPSDAKSLRERADWLREKLGPSIVLLTTEREGKISFVVSVAREITKKGFSALDVAKLFSAKIRGKAGGKETLAEGGAKAAGNLKEILSSFQEEFAQCNQKE